MQCKYPRDCRRSLETIIKKTKKEIEKVDKFISNYQKESAPINCFLTKNDKKKLIDTMSSNSQTACLVIEDLKKHRTEIKYLSSAFDKLMIKYARLKTVRSAQLEQVEDIHNYIEQELQSFKNAQKQDFPRVRFEDTTGKIQQQESDDLETSLEKNLILFSNVSKDYAEFNKYLSDSAKQREDEDELDRILFSVVIKCIRKAFCIRARIESRKVHFLEYAFPESPVDEQVPHEEEVEYLCRCDADSM
ncbi:hypothetical protein QAD02_008941 [Eretmocerus hayati]|uniref:Uncharacterized protein n=1 Tax=Eretmocerus hayati TaxID=131215 RepID=A0ACC2NAC1_9HYME|nr:hypothetical protein QAD02_008941 [Eretmocerus hayati]